MRLVFAFLGLLFCCLEMQAQDLRAVLESCASAYKETQSAYYEAEVEILEEGTLESFTQKVSFQRTNKKRRMPKFRIDNLEGENHELTQIYNIDNFTILDHNSTLAFQYSKEDYQTFMEKMDLEVLHPFMLPTKFLDTKDRRTKLSLLSDTLVEGVICNRVQTTITTKDEKKERFVQSIYTIEAATSLPIIKQTLIRDSDTKENSSKVKYQTVRYQRYDANAVFPNHHFEFVAEQSPYYLIYMSRSALREQWINQEKAQSTFAYGNIAQDFVVRDSQNKLIDSRELKGKVVVLAFFYENCNPCLPLLQDLELLYRIYGERGLEVIAINPIDSDLLDKDIDKFKYEENISFPVCSIVRKTVEEAYLVYSYPTVFVIDRRGRVCFSHQGHNALFASEIEKVIKSKLRRR